MENLEKAISSDAGSVVPSRRRRYHFWSWELEEWRLFFNFFQALGAVAVASLAIWGVFFTSFPETIVRQLRADVADAKEELAGLRAERNRLSTSVDGLRLDLREATDKIMRADEQLAETGRRLSDVTTTLASTQDLLSQERRTISSLRADADGLRVANDAAKTKLEELQSSLARLTADRERYLKIAKLSDFAVFRSRLEKSLDEYRGAILTAEVYVELPKLVETGKALAAGTLKSVSPEMWDMQSRNIELFRRFLALEPASDPNNRDAKPQNIGKPAEQIVAMDLDRSTTLKRITGRALVQEHLTSSASLTPSDGAAYRQTIMRILQALPNLDQSLLIQRQDIVDRGDVATREIARAKGAISAVTTAIDRIRLDLDR